MNVNVTDHSAILRAYLENESNVWDELKALMVEKDALIDSMANVNICCSNDSYIFVYVEKVASFIAISLNKLTKSNNDRPFFQCLSVNAAPLGQIKKCLMNNSGTYILLVYDKSLSAVQLPTKWGKFEQYGNGKLNLICRSVQFNIKSDIVDALWHSNVHEDTVICLAKDNTIRFFSVDNQNSQIKKFNLNSVSSQNALGENREESANRSFTSKYEPSDIVVKLELGKGFLFSGKKANPIFLLKFDGQIDCLIEYESSKSFEYLSSLPLVPFTLDIDLESSKVISISSTRTKPNCLVLLLSNGIIYHCLFLPSRKSSLVDDQEGNLEAEAASELDSEAVLFIYESIRLEDDIDLKSVTFITADMSDPFRYFICHPAGVHLVNLCWLYDLEKDVKSNDNFEFNEFDETSTCEIVHLISTKSLAQSKCHLSGFTVLKEFSRGPDMVIVLTNHFKFIFPHIQALAPSDAGPSLDVFNTSRELYAAKNDQFSDYIKSILKREISLPVLKTENSAQISDDLMVSNVINLIKYEYIEKQRKVMHEFQNRYNLLKKQEKIQAETLKEITQRIQALNERRTKLLARTDQLSKRQHEYENRIEARFASISKNHSIPLTEYETKMLRELDTIRSVAKDFETQISKVKSFTKPIATPDSASRFERKESELDEHETMQIKNLIRNEAEKIKDLMQKVEKLKLTTERMRP